MGEKRRRRRRAAWDEEVWGGVQMGYFQIPARMVSSGGRRQSICQPAFHMSQRSIFFFVKGAFAYLALVLQGGTFVGIRDE